MAEELVVIGAGGFGREIIDVVRAINQVADNPPWQLRGVYDDHPSAENLERLERLEVPYLGRTDRLALLEREVRVVVGIGEPNARTQIVRRLDALDLGSPALIHPRAEIGSDFHAGAGTVVCAMASISTNVTLGRHVHVNPHVVIGHDTELCDFVSANPNGTISGECRIGEMSLIGAAAVVLQRLTVGAGSVVGAAACVVHDTPGYQTLVGIPAQPMRRGTP